MALLLIAPSWNMAPWADTLRTQASDLDVRIWPDETGDPADITHALVWLPPSGVLQKFPNLSLIFSLGAGVDAILKDSSIPDAIPIVRVVEPELTARMVEYVTLHVLRHHRQQRRMDLNQRDKIWETFVTPPASVLRVGLMGLGVLGKAAAKRLHDMGYCVAGWSRSRKTIPGIESFAGDTERAAFLARTDILVCLLPSTPETYGIINTALIEGLSRSGPFGAPSLINAGRGAEQSEADILACLDSGALSEATLDVFETEPLPEKNPLWAHPRVTITPHNAADSDPVAISASVLREMARSAEGLVPQGLVDRSRGY